LKLYLVEGQTDDIHERLLQGDVDLLLLALPYELRSVETLPLFDDRFCLAMRQGSGLADPNQYRFNRLQAESIILLEDGHCLRDHALAACRIRDTQKVSRFSASSLLTLVEMVDADLGITFLPAMARGSAMLRNTRVRLYDLAEDSVRQVGLGWRKGSAREKEFRLFGEFIVKQASG
jgi:LysR family hydrogen peroxide-inducible transcriptional activator